MRVSFVLKAVPPGQNHLRLFDGEPAQSAHQIERQAATIDINGRDPGPDLSCVLVVSSGLSAHEIVGRGHLSLSLSDHPKPAP